MLEDRENTMKNEITILKDSFKNGITLLKDTFKNEIKLLKDSFKNEIASLIKEYLLTHPEKMVQTKITNEVDTNQRYMHGISSLQSWENTLNTDISLSNLVQPENTKREEHFPNEHGSKRSKGWKRIFKVSEVKWPVQKWPLQKHMENNLWMEVDFSNDDETWPIMWLRFYDWWD